MEDILEPTMNYNMCLNPKCSFGIQSGKFLGFMLTKGAIEANPYKFQSIIDVRNPSNIKEVRQLTRRLVAIYYVLFLCGGQCFSFYCHSGHSIINWLGSKNIVCLFWLKSERLLNILSVCVCARACVCVGGAHVCVCVCDLAIILL